MLSEELTEFVEVHLESLPFPGLVYSPGMAAPACDQTRRTVEKQKPNTDSE